MNHSGDAALHMCSSDFIFCCKVKTPAVNNPTVVGLFSLVQNNLDVRSYFIPAKENISDFLPRVDLNFKHSIYPLNYFSG